MVPKIFYITFDNNTKYGLNIGDPNVRVSHSVFDR